MIYAQPLDVSADMGLFNHIARAVFYGMHEVKEETFLGQGDYWDARLHVEYFEYPWENNDGEQELEFHQQSTLTLQFMGNDPEVINELGYTVTFEKTEMGYSSGGTICTEQGVLDENGAFRWSNITRKRTEEDSLELFIEWDDGEEKFNLIRTAPAGSTAG